MLNTVIVVCVWLFLSYWIYVGAREYSQERLWRTWEERFAHHCLAAILPATVGLAFGYESSADIFKITVHLKPFLVAFLVFFIPAAVGLKRGQQLAEQVEKRRGVMNAP
jgi:hypothetical protein